MKKYHIKIVVNKPKKLLVEQDGQETLSVLEGLASMLNTHKTPWYLVGGLGIDMHYGKITRKHTDIDIEIERKDVPQFMQDIKDNNYGLFTRCFVAKIWPRVYMEVYRATRAEECFPERKGRIRMICDGNINPLADYIDVKFCEKTPQGTWLGNDGFEPILITEEYDGQRAQVGSQPVRLRNIAHHKILKSLNANPINNYDMKTIDSVINFSTA